MSCYSSWLEKKHSNLIHSNDKIGTVKPVIDLLKDFTSGLVPCGHIGIGLANKPGVHGYCSWLARTAKPLFNRTLNKEVNISARFIINLSVFNFFQLPSCHTLPRVHETCVMSRALSQPVREVFQLPHNSASQALPPPLSVFSVAPVYSYLSYAALR